MVMVCLYSQIMRCCWIVLVVLLVVRLGCSASNPQDDNEFAEFEEFDEGKFTLRMVTDIGV